MAKFVLHRIRGHGDQATNEIREGIKAALTEWVAAANEALNRSHFGAMNVNTLEADVAIGAIERGEKRTFQRTTVDAMEAFGAGSSGKPWDSQTLDRIKHASDVLYAEAVAYGVQIPNFMERRMEAFFMSHQRQCNT